MHRLLKGFGWIALLFVIITLFLTTAVGVVWMINNAGWWNLAWVVPFFLGICWMMGEDY